MDDLHAIEMKLTAVALALYAVACSIYFIYLAVKKKPVGHVAAGAAWLGVVLHAVALILRGVAAGRMPFTSGYEFASCFAWGIAASYVVVELALKRQAMGAFVLPIAVVVMLYGRQFGAEVQDRLPALKNDLWLTIHVATAIIAYGVLAVSAGTAIMHLIARSAKPAWLPDADWLESATYKVIAFGFPFLTLVVITGAIWADVAWGRPWSWDPKETASLIAWIFYALYLHVRLMAGWKGTGTAVFALVAFVAVIFCYVGPNYIEGLHSYGR
ncbi:MAG: c-type cytochrome biogenesis protein CcsB [Armatimonadota bacterium]